MRVLGLIPARGGSRGIPRKNLAALGGTPLIVYTIKAALDARSLARVVVTTDDEEIASVATATGAEVPFLRPSHLATDDAPSIDCVNHALDELETRGDHYDAVCVLQPTSPLRTAADIDGAVSLLTASGADSVISFTEVVDHHPARTRLVDAEGRVTNPPFAEQVEGTRRQDLPALYHREGSIYLTRAATLRAGSFQGDDCRAWLVPVERACNIDTPFDLELAEFLLRRRD